MRCYLFQLLSKVIIIIPLKITTTLKTTLFLDYFLKYGDGAYSHFVALETNGPNLITQMIES